MPACDRIAALAVTGGFKVAAGKSGAGVVRPSKLSAV
jgi:hypothetical protein